MSNQTTYEPGPPQEPKSGCGGPCFKSCLGIALVLTVLVIALVIGAWWGMGKLMDNFLDSEPMALPEVEMSPDEQEELNDRVAEFEQTLENPGELATIRLTGDEINAFIRNQLAGEEMGRFTEYIYVTVEEGVIRGDISLPISELSLPLGIASDRYLNGAATMRVVLDESEFGLYMDNLELNKRSIPDQYLSEFQNQNLLEEYQNDPEFQRFRESIESFEVQDDTIEIQMRGLPESSEAEPAEESTEEEAPAEDATADTV